MLCGWDVVDGLPQSLANNMMQHSGSLYRLCARGLLNEK
jgi:hypothetical protein